MAKLTWNDNIGTKGAIQYKIAEPNRTAGWRVWVYLKTGMASVGGSIITAKAIDRDAAIQAAEEHFRSFVAELVDEKSTLERLKAYGERVDDTVANEHGTLLRFKSGHLFFISD